ncbi:tetratricopeptide repeat protein [Micromonospora sp. NPDC050187]|uniref:tetratricopeptide repeat protein n=1 Tax=Micromonospora sp. NPDC050187 TaxID=3364277 RepID=UPI00378D1014
MIDAAPDRTDRFGDRLRRLRERAGLTQRELARAAGLSAAAVRDLEQGRSRVPRQRSVRPLVAALGLADEEARVFRAAAQVVRPNGDDQGSSDGPLRVTVLGPLTVHRGDRAVPLSAGRHRVVLGRLALTPNTAVSRDELVHLLWGEEPPPSAVNLVQTYVSRLRRILEPQRTAGARPETLTLGSGGYRLTVTTEQLDLLAWRGLVTAARAADAEPDAALALLDRAALIWLGSPVADIPELRDDPLVTGLREEQIGATILAARLAVGLTCGDQMLPRLRELARHHPLHEPLQACLVVTLAAAGQQAAALGAYEEIRRRLADELGIDPGPELATAHRTVLGQDWPQPAAAVPVGRPATGPVQVRPFQVPAPPADFTGRRDHLRRLGGLLSRDPNLPAPSTMVVAVVSGTAGVGKTALALRSAQLLRPAFPDGQLHVDLQGFGSRPVPPVEVLARFLRALDVADRRIPREEAESAALFRSLLTDRRMLVVLDNARNAAQVRALLPGTGGNAVLITSRNRLAGLAGALVVELGLPSAEEALDMLASVAGSARVTAEAAAAGELVQACGLLPIALRVAGGRLASRPRWTVRSALERLADRRHRLDQLRVGDVAVDASFDLSYQELSPKTARTFRLLALLPGETFSEPAAVALLGRAADEVDDDLHELVDGNLVQLTGGDRYRYHDLLRLYASRRSEAEDPAAERSAALDRLLTWYLEHVAAAMRLAYPEMVRLPVDVSVVTPFPTEDAALAWLDEYVVGLTAAIQVAADGDSPVRAWQLADQLRGYFFLRRQGVPWLVTGRAGLAAAERADDPTARSAMLQTIGQAHWSVGQHELALAAYEEAATLAEQAGWRVGLAYQWHNIGLVQAELGRLDDAEDSYRRALRVGVGGPFDHVRAVTLNDLGTLCHERGRLDAAVAWFSAALEINQGGSRRQSAMANRGNLGIMLRQLGEFDAAREHLETALDHYRRSGGRKGELSILDELSQLHAQRGEPEAAVAAAVRALELTRLLGDRRSEAAVLSTLGVALLCAGTLSEAGKRFRESLRLSRELSSPYFEVQARIGLSRIHVVGGLLDAARSEATAAVDQARRIGYRNLEGEALLALARACVAVGRDEEAARCCREALAIDRSDGAATLVRETATVLARLAAVTPMTAVPSDPPGSRNQSA